MNRAELDRAVEMRPAIRIVRLTRQGTRNTGPRMLSRSTLITIITAVPIFGLCGCKAVYSDTFSYKKNSFKPPVVKQEQVTVPKDAPMPLEGATPGGLLPGGIEGLPGAPVPPDAGGIPGAVPGMPEAAPAPGAPPAPAIPGLN